MSECITLHDGRVQLYLGSADDVLPTIGIVDQFVTSPPYNLGNTTGGGFIGKRLGHYAADTKLGKRSGAGKWSGGGLANGYGAHDDAMPHDEYVAWQKNVLGLMWDKLSATGAIYYNHKPRVLDGALVTPLAYAPDLPLRQIVIWARAGGINFSPSFYCPTHEWVCIFAKPDFRLRDRAASGIGDTWYIPQEGGTEHPAPFPLQLATNAIEGTTSETICDPFMGGGTAGVAAARLGRRFVGIEIERQWFDLACRRIEDATRQSDLFIEPAKVHQESLFAEVSS